jgi:D-alanyl-lipoteichoic acid acyltransferase DltB (MBOAT superfamily)
MFSTFDAKAFFQQFVFDEKYPLLFNNGFFVYLFFCFMLLYFAFRKNVAVRTNIFCLFSLYFFYKASGFFVVLVIISAIADFILSNAIYKQTNASKRKLLLVLSITFNLGLLFYFKYTNFFIQILNSGFSAHINPLNILLPVGISFYTFENISYTVDVYRKEFVPVKKFNEYLLFLSFFPKLVMGPIVRAKDFIPQINQPYYVSGQAFSEGFLLILTGLFRKLIISDYITLNFVDYIFDAPAKYSGLECLFAVYGYAIVIYCDFSGYSSIAIGIARWLGYTIPTNFLSPYQSLDITEFWRRWHISLSSWLRDYLYIPLGGNRKGKLRQYVNLFITMLLGGLWHGASFNFILWGGLHGTALAVHKLWNEQTEKIKQGWNNSWWYKTFTLLLTFHFVCFCWIFFKAKTFTQAGDMLNQITHHFGTGVWSQFFGNYHNVLGMMLLGFLLHAIPDNYSIKLSNKMQRWGLANYVIIFLAFLLVYGFYKSSEAVLPIYLQF